VACLKSMGPLSAAEIIAETGLTFDSVHKLLPRMKARKMVHVGDWTRKHTRNGWAKVWKAGHGVDKPKPAPMTAVEASRAYRERHPVRVNLARFGKTGRFANPFQGLIKLKPSKYPKPLAQPSTGWWRSVKASTPSPTNSAALPPATVVMMRSRAATNHPPTGHKVAQSSSVKT